ncbi:MAG: polyhydroxyalkanoate depolymerase, partial [Lachnospiraceae bacterium]|nr:polyhydroxyalkanoate depolymerase [Lachnospiraceae bacterium]
AITVMYALRPVVEHNCSDSAAQEINDRIYREPQKRGGKVAAAIWPWKCKDALFRFNEAADTRLNQDGMAYDADSGDGTVYEYNFSRQNEGGCVMFCLEEAIHSRFCNNVSFDDLSGTISPAQNPDALLSHNRYYVRKGIPFVRKNMDGGTYTQKADEIILLEEEER